MKIEATQVPIRQLIAEYDDRREEGVFAMGGLLSIRPPYQREFIYSQERQQAVIDSILNGFPINVIYFADRGDGGWEVLDGQQRILSICEFASDRLSIERDGGRTTCNNMEKDSVERFLSYEIQVFLCSGTESQKLAWFRRINIPAIPLTNQELLNVAYTGPWLSAAKEYFSKGVTSLLYRKNYHNYLSGSCERQEFLERALRWIAGRSVEDYMNTHRRDSNANELISHFESVLEWVRKLFPHYRSLMKNVDWGPLYQEHGDKGFLGKYDPRRLESEVQRLLSDDDVTSKRGIYPYLLTEDERWLSVRRFTDSMRRSAYERQGGICVRCDKHFPLSSMQADHITPWSEGGKTEADNLQMLCADCNRRKGDK